MERVNLVTRKGAFEAELIRFEGELMELTLLQDSEAFASNIGDAVTCIYQGKYMTCRVIRLENDSLFVFIPSSAKLINDDRRNNQRPNISLPALLINADVHFLVKVTDIGQHGFGILTNEPSVNIHGEYHLAISSEKLSIVPHIQIVNQIHTLEGTRFGAKILFLQQESELQLKKYILNELFMLSEAP